MVRSRISLLKFAIYFLKIVFNEWSGKNAVLFVTCKDEIKRRAVNVKQTAWITMMMMTMMDDYDDDVGGL